jgi:hypothetical protein
MASVCLLYRCDVEVAPVNIHIGRKAGAAVGSRQQMPRMNERTLSIGVAFPKAKCRLGIVIREERLLGV